MDDKEARIKQFPSPPDNSSVKTTTWKAGKKIERIHSKQFTATQFNPGFGNARFSPVENDDGVVPTIYGGENIGVAIMETLLHDLPTPCSAHPVDMTNLDLLSRSQLIPENDLILVDLNPRTIKKLGATQAQLLGCEAENYCCTQLWASRLYLDNPEAHGLQWPSKQHGGKAVMLFGTRLNCHDLKVSVESENAANSLAVLEELDTLSLEMNLILVPGNI